ncbi:hypothetical protein [Streptomyces indicus]|uniref:Uncharacterized protein n=1 Tax=Streptomyces indicus TaxID=417292 RepID=A0A1G9CKI7_9ACTN|nr:hypothetical protein [Streptomyces indicus]SDK52122.1 hypothetical protein SAMN05421806_108179 [Streptomyces indicus]
MPVDPHRALAAYLRAQSHTVPPQRPRRPSPEIRAPYPGAPDPAPVTQPTPVTVPAPVRPGLLLRLLRLLRSRAALR